MRRGDHAISPPMISSDRGRLSVRVEGLKPGVFLVQWGVVDHYGNLSVPRQSFLLVATIIFVGCRQVKRSIPSDNIEGGRSDILIWPTPG
jgi:hypothetical protein